MEITAPGNILAYLALFSWPLLALALFASVSPQWACAVTLIGGEMFLPPGFGVHISGLPELDKDLMVSLSAIMGCLVFRPHLILRGNRTGRLYFRFMIAVLIGGVFTNITNHDTIRIGSKVIPGLQSRDFVVTAVSSFLCWWPPFFLGRKLFTKWDDLRVLLTVLTLGGLVYSLFIFVELWMSPQFNHWIYGYSAGAFGQTIRAGGYRPTVFMRQGLILALFMLTTVLAATGLARARVRVFGVPARWLAMFLGFVLVCCHSAGALVNALIMVPVLFWAGRRSQTRLATAIAGLVFLYPLLRFLDLVPVDLIESVFTATVGAERAGSLNFRLTNESQMLARALERPWFGWGGWGRQFLYTSWGGKISVVDGEWIGVFGASGIWGFVSVFGLFLFPIFAFAKKKLPAIEAPDDAAIGNAILFVAVAFVFDLLPNSGVAPYLLMIIGALAGVNVAPADARWTLSPMRAGRST